MPSAGALATQLNLIVRVHPVHGVKFVEDHEASEERDKHDSQRSNEEATNVEDSIMHKATHFDAILIGKLKTEEDNEDELEGRRREQGKKVQTGLSVRLEPTNEQEVQQRDDDSYEQLDWLTGRKC